MNLPATARNIVAASTGAQTVDRALNALFEMVDEMPLEERTLASMKAKAKDLVQEVKYAERRLAAGGVA